MKVDLPTREEREEFLEDRKKGVGGSDVPVLAGVLKGRDSEELWKDVLDVYHEKTRPVEEDEITEPRFMRGILLEPVAAYLYMEFSGNRVRRTPTREHRDVPYFRVNTDRIIESDDSRSPPTNQTGACEIKNPHSRSYDKILEFGIPRYYICQLQWEMFVHNYNWGAIVVGGLEHDRGPVLYHSMEAKPLLQEQLAELAERFWTEHVQPRRPPDPVEWHGETWVEVPDIEGERVTLTDERARYLAHRVMRRYDLRNRAKDAYSEAKETFQEFMEAHDLVKVEIPGQGKVNYGWREGRSRLDRDKLEEARLIDRDALVRALVEGEIALDGFDPDFGPEQAERLLDGLEVDLSRFETQYDAYRSFRPYPEDELLPPSELPDMIEGETNG